VAVVPAVTPAAKHWALYLKRHRYFERFVVNDSDRSRS
jgi:hypothetical protein